MIEIVPMNAGHPGQVAQLHLENLQTKLYGRAGRELLKLYYETIIKETGGCGYVAINQGDVLGYVCGIWDARTIRKELLHDHWFSMALWGAIHVVQRPEMIFNFLDRFHSIHQADASPDKGECSIYELRPIVVTTNGRRSGLGRQLVKRLLDDARLRGYGSIHLYTEQENETAQRFYEKIGFLEAGTLLMNGGQYLRYELTLF